MPINQDLLKVALEQTPAIIGYLRIAFAKRNPDAPTPTNAEIIAAYNAAFQSSVDKDEAWLAAHPF